MKLILIIACLLPAIGLAQSQQPTRTIHPDLLLEGFWEAEGDVCRVQFERETDSTYQARIIWVPQEKDKHLENTVFIKGIWHNAKDKKWYSDSIYQPRFKMTGKGFIELREDGKLFILGRKLGIKKSETFVFIPTYAR